MSERIGSARENWSPEVMAAEVSLQKLIIDGTPLEDKHELDVLMQNPEILESCLYNIDRFVAENSFKRTKGYTERLEHMNTIRQRIAADQHT